VIINCTYLILLSSALSKLYRVERHSISIKCRHPE
jgi:hypothetical protein